MKAPYTKAYHLLKILAQGGGILVASLIAPTLPHVLLKAYMRGTKFERHIFFRDLKRLQERKLLDLKKLPDGNIKITLRAQGRTKILEYDLETLSLPITQKWDHRWRLVMFDIPTKYNTARDALRRKLRKLGFYQLQNSVFISPHPCEKEIEFVCSFFGVRDYVLILPLTRFEGEEKLKKHFRLS